MLLSWSGFDANQIRNVCWEPRSKPCIKPVNIIYINACDLTKMHWNFSSMHYNSGWCISRLFVSVLQTLYVYVCVCVCVCVLLCNMLHETHINAHQREHCYYYYIKSTKGTSTRRYHPALLVVFSVPLGVKNQVFDAVHWSCYMWWIRTLCCLFVRTAVPSSLLISRTSWSNKATSLATTLRKCHRHWQVHPTVVI